ncbi:Dynein axonemal heavy chain 9 [Labeo rohita]|uniref:Dynein axonemal heavy chain 9 n=1 Tax=Labeo rohita TaxID=84645 RepID=A0ABQ8L8B7_LABRO|nr:Dynein axonemal heavy chain 9 [Labeo rohita]
MCRQQLYLLQALSRLFELVQQPSYSTASYAAVDSTAGLRGRPRFAIEREETIFRRMNDVGLSVSGLYSSITDEELENTVRNIKDDVSAAGHRRSEEGCCLKAYVYNGREQLLNAQSRLLSRLARLGCVCLLVIWYQEQTSLQNVMYLNAANNNQASTATTISQKQFRNLVHHQDLFILNIRVRGDQGVENVQISRYMFSSRGADRGSFTAEQNKSVSNRIERLWRDVRITVTNKYSHMLHSLEAEGLLDLSVVEELFCVHYTFLPRLQADLDTFAEDIEEPDLDWDTAASYDACEDLGVVVPEFECPLSPDGLRPSNTC